VTGKAWQSDGGATGRLGRRWGDRGGDRAKGGLGKVGQNEQNHSTTV